MDKRAGHGDVEISVRSLVTRRVFAAPWFVLSAGSSAEGWHGARRSKGGSVPEHLANGRRVAVTGRLEYREWQGQDGSPHSKHEVVADQVEFRDAPPKQAAHGAPEPAYAAGEEPF